MDHAILLKKLSGVGVNELSICWLRSYLTGRLQVTDVDGTMSVAKGITCGVSQGSILGPLVFRLYTNDMSAAVKCKLLLYADDSVLLASGKDIVEIEATLSSELKSVNDWLNDNKLSLHLGKRQSIVFGTRKKLCKCNTLNIVCNGIAIESKSTVTYLGVTLDQSLSGDVIASDVLFKTSNKLKFLCRNARKFNMKSKQLLVSFLIQCHFDYTCSEWYRGLSKKMNCRKQRSQNKIIRFLLNAPPRFHVGANEFKTVGLLRVEHRVEQLKLGHML